VKNQTIDVDDEYIIFKWDTMSCVYSGDDPLKNKSFSLKDEILEVIYDDPDGKEMAALKLAEDLVNLARQISSYYTRNSDGKN